MIAVPGDLPVPARVVAGEGVPERAGRPEHGELLALVVGKQDVGEERQQRREQAEQHRGARNLHRGVPARPVEQPWETGQGVSRGCNITVCRCSNSPAAPAAATSNT